MGSRAINKGGEKMKTTINETESQRMTDNNESAAYSRNIWTQPTLKRLSLKDAESTSSFTGNDGTLYS